MTAAGRRAELTIAAALLSAGAAAIHASAAGAHFEEYLPFGVLFAVSAVAQAAWAALVLAAPSRLLLAAGVAGNAGIAAVWGLSRTSGLPFGPEPWAAEPVAPLDVAATAFELGIVAVGIALLAARLSWPRRSDRDVTRVAALGAVAVTGLACAAFAASRPDGAAHDEAGPTTPAATAPASASAHAAPHAGG